MWRWSLFVDSSFNCGMEFCVVLYFVFSNAKSYRLSEIFSSEQMIMSFEMRLCECEFSSGDWFDSVGTLCLKQRN